MQMLVFLFFSLRICEMLLSFYSTLTGVKLMDLFSLGLKIIPKSLFSMFNVKGVSSGLHRAVAVTSQGEGPG